MTAQRARPHDAHDEEPGPPGCGAFGPQGAALVLELRRIQEAFDHESGGRPRPSRQSTRRMPPTPPRPTAATTVAAPMVGPPPPVQRNDGEAEPSRGFGFPTPAVTRAVDLCLEQVKSGCGFLLARASGVPVEQSGAALATRLGRSFERELRTGLRVLLAGAVLVGGWATLVPLSGAVVVPGTLVVESSIKKIQHQTGGIVAQIRARDGMHVHEGDLLVRLDETQARTNLQVIARQLDQVRVRVARLIAERDGLAAPDLPAGLAARSADNDLAQLLASERSLFAARGGSRRSQKELLRSRIGQLNEEIAGLEAQINAKAAQLDLIAGELKGVQILYDKQLVTLPRLTGLQREAARLDGERGQLISSIAEARGKISESELQIARIDQDFRTEVMKDLRESQDKEAELAERAVAAKDQLDRIDIRAPTSGVVHELAAHTIGGVVAPAEVIMEIVPDSDELQIEARLPTSEIDHVHVGQSSLVRLSAFNQRTTPQLGGLVSYVSADLSRDKQTSAAFYTVHVTLPGNERRRLGDLQLVSGMPAEVFLQTSSRTMMSYLFKPITEQWRRTFSEP